MKKRTIKILTGVLFLAIIILMGSWQYYLLKKKEYRNQLEKTIDNKYLEGQNAIGAYYYTKNDSINIEKVSDFEFDNKFSWYSISDYSFWGGQYFNHTETIFDMLKSGDYKWYDFKSCATMSPFLVVVKKTNRGYDIIGEFILGLGLTNFYPNYLIRKETTIFDFRKLGGKTEIIRYYIPSEQIISSYIKWLFSNEYENITIRKELTQDNFAIKRNFKLDMLNELVQKPISDSSLYFRVNKYYELKFDQGFTDMGIQPIVWQTRRFGNSTYSLFITTVTMHYSIQENKGVLEKECKKNAIIILIISECFYLILILIFYKKKLL